MKRKEQFSTIIFPETPGVLPWEEGNVEGKWVIIDHKALHPKFWHMQNQLFLATSGFGCEKDKVGRKIFGSHIGGEKACWQRDEIIGIASEELIQKVGKHISPNKELIIDGR